MTKIDFEALDKSVLWKYHYDKLNCAKRLGYSYLSEAMYDLHFNKMWRLKDIATALEYGHTIGLKIRFKKFGWQYRIEPHGGNRNYSKLFEHYETIRQQFQNEKHKKTRELSLWYEQKGEEYGVHPYTIRACCMRQTWKNKV